MMFTGFKTGDITTRPTLDNCGIFHVTCSFELFSCSVKHNIPSHIFVLASLRNDLYMPKQASVDRILLRYGIWWRKTLLKVNFGERQRHHGQNSNYET